MSLSVDAIRREIGERRDRLTRLHRAEDQVKQRIEEAEAALAHERAELERTQATIGHEDRSVAALQAAVAVLTERLPSITELPEPERTPTAPPPEPERKPTPRRRNELTRPSTTKDPLKVNRHQVSSKGRRRATSLSPQTSVQQRAVELDLASVSTMWLERANLICQVLTEADEPMRQRAIAVEIAELMDCGLTTAASIVSRALAVLCRQGRVYQPDERGKGPWAVTPPERASAGLGVGLDNYDGKTTRWPEGGRAPARGTHIDVAGNFEGGKRR